MKKVFLFTVAALVCNVTFSQVVNTGFEDWTDNPVPTYSDPDGWTTLNSLSTALGGQLVFKATAVDEVYAGTAAARMTTAQLVVGVTPGVITNGTIDAQSESIIGGKPYTERPVVFGGWFRYDPANVDTGFVSITLTRWDAVNGVRETIGTGNEDIFSTNGLFENVEVTIAYESSEMPDTVLIIMGPGNDIEPQVGSNLFADELYFSNSPASVETAESAGLIVYPNPTNNLLRISSSSEFAPASASIFSIDGKHIRTVSVAGTVEVSDLKSGMYLLELSDKNGRVVQQRFVKN